MMGVKAKDEDFRKGFCKAAGALSLHNWLPRPPGLVHGCSTLYASSCDIDLLGILRACYHSSPCLGLD